MSRWRKIGLGIGLAVGVPALALGAWLAYVMAFAEGRAQFPDTAYPDLKASTDPAIIEQGRYLVHGPAHCSQCHSTSDRDNPAKISTEPLKGGLEFAMGPIATTWAPNLTPDQTGIGRRTDAELARMIRTGVGPNGAYSIFMGVAAAKPADEDVIAILSYLRSIEPVNNAVPDGEWRWLGKILLMTVMEIAPGPQEGPRYVAASEEPSIERGEYLAENLMLCVGCHSEVDMATFKPIGAKAAGATVAEASHGADSDMEYLPPNLTSHPTGITGKLDEDAFVARMKGGRKYASTVMPWENFATVTDADLRSVYRYLKSLPPVDRDLGPSYRKIGWTPEG